MTIMHTLECPRAVRLIVLSTLVTALILLFIHRTGQGGQLQDEYREIAASHDSRLAAGAQDGHAGGGRRALGAVDRSFVKEEPVMEAPALAGPDPLQDALNASREAQRIASVNLDGVVYQALGYVSDLDRKVVVALRNDQGSDQWTEWNVYVYDGADGLPDLGTVSPGIHHWVSVGFDAAGYLHLTWEMHNDPLQYRRASAPADQWNGELTDNRSMRGANEDSVTYVRFHLLGETLYTTFRDGGAGDGDWYFYEYDLQDETWRAGPGLDATEGMLLEGGPDDQNPYLFRDPALDEQGNIHFAWNWRASEEVSTNHAIEYCRWNGSRYVTTEGTALSVPIREGEAEEVDPAGSDSGLADMEALAVDAEGRPHLAYRKDGPDGHMQMFHTWHDGATWRSTQLTHTEHPSYFALTDDGGMYLSGAALASRSDTTMSMVFTDAADDNHLAMWTARPPFDNWSKEIIYDERDLGYYEASFDRRTLREQGQLYIPLVPWDTSDPEEGWPISVLRAGEGAGDGGPSENGPVNLPGNYPNPMHDRSTVPYELASSGQVRLVLYNGAGQRVQTLVNGFQEAGSHQVELDAQPLASGVYVLWLEMEGHSAIDKITIVK